MILAVHQYRDRTEAGQVLARQLAHYASRVDTLVLALSPGAVPIAVVVAHYLNAPLDAFMVRPLALPANPDRAFGAVAAGGASVFDDEAIAELGITPEQLAQVTVRESNELERRQLHYRGPRAAPQIDGRVVIAVDDGLATGFSMHAAVIALHRQQPAWLVAAVPVGSAEACEDLAQEVHEMVCPLRPDPLQSIGIWYDHFLPPDDDDIRATLRRGGGLPRV